MCIFEICGDLVVVSGWWFLVVRTSPKTGIAQAHTDMQPVFPTQLLSVKVHVSKSALNPRGHLTKVDLLTW